MCKLQLSNHGTPEEQRQLLVAIAHMKRTCPDQYNRLINALNVELDMADINLRGADGASFGVAQGHAQRLEQIISFLAQAEETLMSVQRKPQVATP